MQLTSILRHPLSAMWGDMPEDELNALSRDIAEVGIRDPIVMWEGKVLDGWHRLQAAILAGLTVLPKEVFAEFEGDDPAGFVIRRNGLRRNITATQRTAIILMAREWWDERGGRPAASLSEQAMQEAGSAAPEPTGPEPEKHDNRCQVSPQPRTTKELADEAGASPSMVTQTKKRIREGHGPALASGEETLASLNRKERAAKKDKKRKTADKPLSYADRLKQEIAELKLKVEGYEHNADEATAAENLRLRAENEELRTRAGNLEKQVDTWRALAEGRLDKLTALREALRKAIPTHDLLDESGASALN